jgi:hypothetical protein
MPAKNHMVGERRKNPRLGLAIPVRVEGFLAEGQGWQELASTADVSSGGACFALSHEVELGQVLLLSLALPKRLRQYDLGEPTYRVYALVRGVHRHLEQPQVGVMFFGKFPPRGFEERPEARYLLPTDALASAPMPQGLRDGRRLDAHAAAAGEELDVAVDVEDEPAPAPPQRKAGVPPWPSPEAAPNFLPAEIPGERRSAPRVEVFVNFMIQLVDEWGAVLQEELTVADNVAPGGARVMTSLPFQVGDVLLLREASRGGFETRAEVRGVTRVQPTVDRLHLRFVDGRAPQRLLRL